MVSALLGQNIPDTVILRKNHVIMTFLPSVFVMERVKYLPTRVRMWVDGCGPADTDRCSLH